MMGDDFQFSVQEVHVIFYESFLSCKKQLLLLLLLFFFFFNVNFV